jgi:hypothetical protein
MKRLLLLAAVLLVGGCGDATGSGGETGSEPDLTEPPPITLHLADRDLELRPWTWCYGNGCVDGWHGDDLESVGSPSSVEFSFPEEDWHFTATFNEHGVEKCARRISMPVEPAGDGSWVIEPAGPAGTWDVDISGGGPGGDVITTFTWTTPTDGALPGTPTGSAAVLADHDGELDSYGVEIGVDNLAAQPREASASVTVTSADGQSVTIDTKPQRSCYSEGSLWFTASDDVGRRATELGAGPFEYAVELTLDGATYTGRGSWPDGETEDIAPHVPLTWAPELPAYTGG